MINFKQFFPDNILLIQAQKKGGKKATWICCLLPYLGIVQGVPEFLPVSSTGHLILVSHLMGMRHTDFLKSFEIAIQAGSIFSVMVLYWRKLLVDFQILKKVVIAFIPTGIMGLTLYKLIKQFLLGSSSVVLFYYPLMP